MSTVRTSVVVIASGLLAADSVRNNRRNEFEGRADLLRNHIALRDHKK